MAGKQQSPDGPRPPEGTVTVEFVEDVQYRSVGNPQDDRDFSAGEQYELRPDVAARYVTRRKAHYVNEKGEKVGHPPLPTPPASVAAQAVPNPAPGGPVDAHTRREAAGLPPATDDDDEDAEDTDDAEDGDEDSDAPKAATTRNTKAVTGPQRDKSRKPGQSHKK